jgi:hypothetical protein
MQAIVKTLLSALILCTIACTAGSDGGPSGPGSSGNPPPGGDTVDAPMTQPPPTVDAPASTKCGKPGDMGNSLGVGKYCTQLTDCFGLKAGICAILGGDPNQTFCTMSCTMGSTTACGENAMCACQGGQCGCVPNACLM